MIAHDPPSVDAPIHRRSIRRRDPTTCRCLRGRQDRAAGPPDDGLNGNGGTDDGRAADQTSSRIPRIPRTVRMIAHDPPSSIR